MLTCQKECIDITDISPRGTYSEMLMQKEQKEDREAGEMGGLLSIVINVLIG